MVARNTDSPGRGAHLLSMDAWRWGMEVTSKERKSGWHLGHMPVIKERARVGHSGALSVLAYLLLVRL